MIRQTRNSMYTLHAGSSVRAVHVNMMVAILQTLNDVMSSHDACMHARAHACQLNHARTHSVSAYLISTVTQDMPVERHGRRPRSHPPA